jgi:hypothetical protein
MIYRIDPVDTPFMTGVEREKATAVNHEWQTQALARRQRLECPARRRRPDRPTRPRRPCASATMPDLLQDRPRHRHPAGCRARRPRQRTGLPGNAEGPRAEARHGTVLCGTNQAKVTGNSTTARKTASVLSWIKSNTATGGTSPADPAAADGTGTRTDGTARWRRSPKLRMKTVLSAIWINGGKPNVVMTGAFNKQAFSTFTGRGTAFEETGSKKIVASVDAYESDFGKLKVVANRFQRTRDVLILQMEKWAIAFLNGRNMISIPLAKTGDSDRRQILAEYALVARNEKASGGVFDNTSS